MPYGIDKTPFGFPFVLLGQQMGALSGTLCVSMTINMHISLNFYVIASINDMRVCLNELNELLIHRMTRKVELATIYKSLTEILKLHYWIIQ